ncbi:MAG: aldolase/citrate lyase family protein [Verrucomicrobiota bacterium]
MKTQTSRVKKKLGEGLLPTVLKINLSDPRVIEIAALAGIDSVWLCTEHVPNDWLSLENQIRAARIHGIDTLVRVGRGSYSDYIRPFEAGATGIIVPHVASEEEARQIVEWVRFHPLGKRALDGGNIDGNFCLTPIEEYVRNSNEERLVILQIESPEALAQVDKIAAVPGYDGILFGPGDFSHRIGKIGQLGDPEVVAARKRVAAAAVKHGKFAMTAGLIAPLPELVAEGYRLLGVGADVALIGKGVTERLRVVNEQITALPASAKIPQSPYA